MAAPGRWLPPHKRPGYKGTGTEMSEGYQSPKEATAGELKAIGFVEGAGGQLYYPKDHPHVHIGIGINTFMAYSEGEQHLGGSGISMYKDKAVQKGYTTAVGKMKKTYGDTVGAKIFQALGILRQYDIAQG